MSPTLIPAPTLAPREEWPDADFDLEEGDTIIQDDLDSDGEGDLNKNPIRRSRLRMSSGPTEMEMDEDWDADFGGTAKLVSLPKPSLPLAGTVTKLGAAKPKPVIIEEDWDNDVDFGAKPTMTLSRPPTRPPSLSLADEPNWDADGSDDEGGNASTIKVSKLPPIPPKAPLVAPTFNNDDDFEDAFSLPTDLSHLSLRPLAHRISKSALEWSSDTTASYSSESPSSFGFSHKHTSESPSSQPDTEFTDDDEADEGEVEGLILPDLLVPKDLAKILDAKKRGQAPAKPLKAPLPDAEDDFENGLDIGDDAELSPSRLRKSRAARSRGTSMTSRLPAPIPRPPSRIILTKASTLPSPLPPSTSQQSLLPRVTSPLRRRKPAESLPPRYLATSPTPLPVLRRSKPTTARSDTLSPPPLHSGLSHSYSLLSLPRAAKSSTSGTPTNLIKHQKSHGRLLSKGDDESGSMTPTRRGLVRKASLSSLVDAAHQSVASSSPYPHQTPGSNAALSRGTISHTSAARYNAPTASSRAKNLRSVDAGVVGSDRDRHHQAPSPTPGSGRPLTPSSTSSNPTFSTQRLTMPTSSSRAKARMPVSNIFPTSSSQSPLPSPHYEYGPSNRLSSASPIPRSRPRSSGGPLSPPRAAAKVMRRPKKSRAFGDGSELDGIEDLVVEKDKERKYRVTPTSASKDKEKIGLKRASGSSNASSSMGTLGRKPSAVVASSSIPMPTSVAAGKRSMSRASVHSPDPVAPMRPPALSLRQKSRVEFPMSAPQTAPLLGPAPSAALYATNRRKRGQSTTQKKPTLIRNLSGVGSPRVVGDMKWNPQTLRWEGNETALRDFESHMQSSARPALITHLTGSSVGGMASPTGFLANGARIVGNMIFDPAKMCWINRYADEEPDVFAGMDDDDSDEDKDATWGKGRGATIRAVSRASALAPSNGTPLETVIGSPARSAISRSSGHRQSASLSESDDSESVVMSGSPGRLASLVRGASTSPIPDVDEDMVDDFRKAEERHRAEVKGWYPRARRAVAAGFDDDDDNDDEPHRAYLFEIRALATRKY